MADDSKALWSEEQINAEVGALRRDYREHMDRLRVRRLLIDMIPEAAFNQQTGTYIPAPFDQSRLIVVNMIGDVQQAVLHYASRIAANSPQPVVSPAVGKGELTQRVDRHAADQERLLAALWEGCGGRQAQWKVGWSQAWGRAGWYFTLPREAQWGLPERLYYDENDSELERLQAEGKARYTPDEGTGKYAESGSSWMERRRKAAEGKALNGRNLFTLDAFGPDVVYPRFDTDGVKYAAIVTEAPRSDFRPGSELAKLAAQHAGLTGDDIASYGLYLDEKGKVVGGVTTGGEERGGSTWTLIRFVTREEVYYLVGGTPGADSGTLIYHCKHLAPSCPLVWVPGIVTDSARPGSEASSPMESVFAQAPALNQMLTLMSNAAGYNGIPRWVYVKEDGRLVVDPDTGDPLITVSETVPGLDPTEATVVPGTPIQLTVNIESMVKVLEIYIAQLEKALPAPAAQGAAGTSGAAWTLRQLIQQAQENLRQPVDNNAHAVKQIMLLWTGWLRALDVPVYQFAAPTQGKSDRKVKALIEFDPEDLIDAFEVRQDSNTASDRIVLQQAGIEMLNAGVITMRQYLEHYALEDDARQAEVDLAAYKVSQFVMFGDQTQIMPGSLLFNVAQAVQGRITAEMLKRSPNFAMATAEGMAQNAQMMAQQQLMPPAPEGGNPAEAAGLRQAGMGMGVTQPGSPEGALPPVGAGPVAVA